MFVVSSQVFTFLPAENFFEEQINELNTPDKNVIWLNAQRRELETTIDDLNNRVSDLKGNKRDLEDKVASLEAMNQKFVGSYKQFLEQKEKLVNISQTLDEQKKELEENLAEEKHNNNKLTGENGRHLQKIMSMENQNTDLLRELNDTKSLYKEEITKREELQMKVASCEKTNADLLSQLEVTGLTVFLRSKNSQRRTIPQSCKIGRLFIVA